jgi:phosphoribosyl-ATP pyrophosphohydrolase
VNDPAPFTLEALEALIAARAKASGDRSYTRQLLDAGPPRTAKKFGEEAVELVIASLGGSKPELIAEAADVIYHFLVLLRVGGVGLDQVVQELGRRTRQSGLDEKASRSA